MTNIQKGFYLVLGTALISGLANFFNKSGMQALGKDAFQYTTLKNIVVALILTLIILTPFIFKKLKALNKKDWLKLSLIGLIGGSIPFLLFFKGLSLTSPVSASFIHKTLFIWVAILALPILKEKLSKLQFVALGVLFVGNIIFNGFSGLTFGYAEILILIATLLWSLENVIAKIALKSIDSPYNCFLLGDLFLNFQNKIAPIKIINVPQIFSCGNLCVTKALFKKVVRGEARTNTEAVIVTGNLDKALYHVIT